MKMPLLKIVGRIVLGGLIFSLLTVLGVFFYQRSSCNIDFAKDAIFREIGVPVAEIQHLGGGKRVFPCAVFTCSTNWDPTLKMKKLPEEQLHLWRPSLKWMERALEFYKISIPFPERYYYYFCDNPKIHLIKSDGCCLIFYHYDFP